MILSDKQIKKLAVEREMISPFVDKSVSKGISHGLNSFGFDLKYSQILKELQLTQKTFQKIIL